MANESEIQRLGTAGVNLLPAGAVMRGEIHSDAGHQILLSGKFEGRLTLGGQSHLVIGPTAHLTVELVQADQVLVLGTVDGTISANHVEIGNTGCVTGTLRYAGSFVCQRGANISASIQGPTDPKLLT